jgi:hypothetical protein
MIPASRFISSGGVEPLLFHLSPEENKRRGATATGRFRNSDRLPGGLNCLARMIHEVSTADDDAPHPAVCARLGVLHVLMSTRPRPSGRKPHWPRHLAQVEASPCIAKRLAEPRITFQVQLPCSVDRLDKGPQCGARAAAIRRLDGVFGRSVRRRRHRGRDRDRRDPSVTDGNFLCTLCHSAPTSSGCSVRWSRSQSYPRSGRRERISWYRGSSICGARLRIHRYLRFGTPTTAH